MENILVTLDGSEESESVLPYAAAIAKGFGSHVTLLHSVHHPMTGIYGEDPSGWQLMEEIDSNSETWASEYLHQKQAELEALEVQVSSVVARGNPAEVILDYANDNSPDLVAMSTHGRAGLSRLIVGSTAQRVLHSCKSPVLLIHPIEDEQGPIAQLEEINVPLDTSELSASVLPLARELAKKLGLKMSLISAVPTEADLYLGIEYMVHPARLLEETTKMVSDYLSDMAREIRTQDNLKVSWEVLHGDAGRSIVEYAKERPNNMIAMSTHGRSGLGRWVLGSVADKVVRSSGDPVIVFRPGEK